ncbi:MAG TPA: TRAP transporter small permease [Casimicrobiaceae bacterium]|nr:TRAP transporter small permease [Casimicrobiaceae bacterium]
MTHGAATIARLERFRAGYGRVLEWVVAALMIALAAEVTLGVVYRTLGSSLSWYDELASHMLAWLTFYGAALASVKRAHIGCPELVAAMPWPARRAVSLIAQVVVIAFFALLGAIGVSIMPILATDSLISLPDVPMSVVQSVIPISAALIVVAEMAYLLELWQARDPREIGAAPAATADALH